MLTEVRAREPSPEVSKGAVGQETVDELRALGYVGPADAAKCNDCSGALDAT